MGIATHLGPWLLGTVKNTTGTAAGTVANVGATFTGQTKAVAFGDTAASVACVLPAGSLIFECYLMATTAFTSGTTATIQLFVNGSAITAATTISTGATGLIELTPGTSNPALVTNVGTTDAIITYTISTATAGAGVLVLQYMVRNADGTLTNP